MYKSEEEDTGPQGEKTRDEEKTRKQDLVTEGHPRISPNLFLSEPTCIPLQCKYEPIFFFKEVPNLAL